MAEAKAKRVRHAVRFLSSVLACGALTLHARAEEAPSDADRASGLFLKGRAAYNSGRYEDALRLYSQAWSLKQAPDIAANLAQSELEVGRYFSAANHFAFALGHLLPSTTSEQKEALENGLAAAKRGIATLHITLEPADATLRVDGTAQTLPSSGEIYLEPGEHRLQVTRDAYRPSDQTMELAKGSERVLWIKLSASAPSATPAAPPAASVSSEPEAPPLYYEPRDHGSRPLWPALVGGGLAVGGVAVGVAFLISANGHQRDADRLSAGLTGNECGGAAAPPQCPELSAANADLDRARNWEIASFAVAGAAAVGTVAYLLWPRSSHASAGVFVPGFSVARGGGAVTLGGRL